MYVHVRLYYVLMVRARTRFLLVTIIYIFIFDFSESFTDLSSPGAAQICPQNCRPATIGVWDTFFGQDTFSTTYIVI